MTTNQTIDGVPRELLLDIEYWLKHMEAEKGVEGRCSALKELRALLDKEVTGDSRAPQPLGEPVAHCLLRRNGAGEWVNDAKSWVDGVPCREIVAECETHPELYRLRFAYAEQPASVAPTPINYGALDPVERLAVCRGEVAPVAVALPERMTLEKPESHKAPVEVHNGVVTGWNACLDELKRLNGIER